MCGVRLRRLATVLLSGLPLLGLPVLPGTLLADIEDLLRDYEVVPKRAKAAHIKLRDADDRWVVATAVAGHAGLLVTGDRDLLDAADDLPVPAISPRAFWN